MRQALVRLGRAATESLDFLSEQLDALWPEISSIDGKSVTLDTANLKKLHPTLRAMAFRRAFAQASGSIRRLSETHVKSMLALSEGPAGKIVHLPGNLAVRSTQDRLVIGPLQSFDSAPTIPDYEHPLNVPGTTRVPGWLITAETALPDLDPTTLAPTEALFDADKVGGRLVVRNRRPGDYLQPLGMTGRKKLKDLFIDLKVPRELRLSTPLLVSEKGVLWVYPYRTSELARVDETTRRRLLVRWESAACP